MARDRPVRHIVGFGQTTGCLPGHIPPGLHVISNGKATTPDDLRFMADHGVHLMLSLPGIETYAQHTGGGDPGRVLALFEEAARIGLPTTVGVTVTRRNLHEAYTTIGHAFLAGAGSLLLNRFLPGGRGLANRVDLTLDMSDVGLMLDEADAALRAAGRDGHLGTELPMCAINLAGSSAFRSGPAAALPAASSSWTLPGTCASATTRRSVWPTGPRRRALDGATLAPLRSPRALGGRVWDLLRPPPVRRWMPRGSRIVARAGNSDPLLRHCNPT